MTSAIVMSLEKLADLVGDPQEEIYRRLYSQYPDLQSLFVLDTDESVRGSMLQTTLEFVLAFGNTGNVDAGGLTSWRSHHLEYGVEADVFIEFFKLTRDYVEECLGSHWTESMSKEWREFLEKVERT